MVGIAGTTSDSAKEAAMKAIRQRVNSSFGAIGTREPTAADSELWVQHFISATSNGHQRWDPWQHVVGPIECISLTGDWEFHREAWEGPAHHFRIYKLKQALQPGIQDIQVNQPVANGDSQMQEPALNDQELDVPGPEGPGGQDAGDSSTGGFQFQEIDNPVRASQDLPEIDAEIAEDSQVGDFAELQQPFMGSGMFFPEVPTQSRSQETDYGVATQEVGDQTPYADEDNLLDQAEGQSELLNQEFNFPADDFDLSEEGIAEPDTERKGAMKKLQRICNRLGTTMLTEERSELGDDGPGAGDVGESEENELDAELLQQINEDELAMMGGISRPEWTEIFAALEERLPKERALGFTTATVTGALQPMLVIPHGSAPGSRVLMFFSTASGKTWIEFGLAGKFGFKGRSGNANDYTDAVNKEWRGKWNYAGAIIYSIAAPPLVEIHDNPELGSPAEVAKRWRSSQERCDTTKHKIWFLSQPSDKRTWDGLAKRCGNKLYRAEKLDLERRNFSLENVAGELLLHMDGLRVVPDVDTDSVLGPNSMGNPPRAKRLITWYCHKAHQLTHDHEAAKWRLLEEWGIWWRHLETALRVYESTCLKCVAEKSTQRHARMDSEIEGRKNARWHLDLQGPFGEAGEILEDSDGTPKTGAHLFTMIDDATGYPFVRCIKDKSQKQCLKAFKSVLNEAFPEVYGHGGKPNANCRIAKSEWLQCVRSDNGFPFLQRYFNGLAKATGLPKIKHLPSTAENAQANQRIERPHRQYRKWVNVFSDVIKGKAITDSTAKILQRAFRNRPVAAYFRYTPSEIYWGRMLPGAKDVAEAIDHRQRDSAALTQQLTSLRAEKAEQSYYRHLQTHGLALDDGVAGVGDICLPLLRGGNRKSKKNYTGNYAPQIFSVVQIKHRNNAVLSAAMGDKPPRFRMPVHLRRTLKLHPEFKKYLQF